MKYKYRDYQENVHKDTDEFMHESSHKKGLIVNPVGTGKSLIPAMIAGMTDHKCLVVQPNIELLEQNLEKAQSFGLDPSVYSSSAGMKNISKLTYATPMSVVKRPEDFKDFDVVCVDEAHLNMTNKMVNGKPSSKGKFNEFLDQINPKKIIGLTATPIQLVTTGIGSELKMLNRSMRSYFYKSDIFHVTQIQDIQSRYWGDIKTEIVKNDTSSLERKRFNSPEFTPESIVKQYDANGLDYQIVDQYEKMIDRGIDNILTFVPSVEQGLNLVKKNKDFVMVYDKTPAKERKAIVSAFKRGDISHLVNCMIFTAGFDHPGLKGLIMARETNSYQLFYQVYGRIVRPIYIENKLIRKKGLFVDLTGNSKRFGSVDNLTYEKNDYTNGWAMWNNDSLLTGVPFGDWDMPQRDSLLWKSKTTGIISKDQNIEDVVVNVGKYNGRSLIESFKKDARYFVWMYNNFDFSNPKFANLKPPIEKLIEKNIMHGS